MLVAGSLEHGKDVVQALGEMIQVLAEVIASAHSDRDRDRLLQQAMQLLHLETQQTIHEFARQGRYAGETTAENDDGA